MTGISMVFAHLTRILRFAILALLVSTTAFAQESGSADTLTEAEILEDPEAALAALSDRDVRTLLLEYLETKEKADETWFSPADFAFALQNGFGIIHKRATEVFGAFPLLPDVFAESFKRILAKAAPGEFGDFLQNFLVALVVAGLVEWLLRRRLRSIGFYSLAPASRFATQIGVLIRRLLVSLMHILVFTGLAAAVYFAIGDENENFRATFVFYMTAIVITRLGLSAAEAFYAPHAPQVRMPGFSDAEALWLKRTLSFTVACGAFGFFTCSLFAVHGVVGHAHELLLILTGTVTIASLVFSILVNRKALVRDILATGSEPTRAREIMAMVWPYAQSVLVVVMWIAVVASAFLGQTPLYGAALTTIFLFLVAPSFESAFEREATLAIADDREMAAAIARTGRLAVPVLVIIVLAIAWRVDLLTVDDGSIASQVTHAGLQIAGTLMIAYLLWYATQVWIDGRIKQEELEYAAQTGADLAEMEIGGAGQSRLRTLLPLIKRTFQITIGFVTIMIVMSALGIDIAPVLAGAGVVGLAIGFGSQTLVRDVVSGIFFLLDDAFRLGEYVDVGDVKGSVERISIRSFQLRHHRGAVNTVPFGEIKVLKNYSRDWAIMKLRFRVSFDADLERVRKIMKAVGRDLLENPEIAEDFLQPFKSQGVLEVDDYGFVVRAKFMSKPGKQFMIRRHAYLAVQQAFAENGIEFAKPEVRVIVGDDDEDSEKQAEYAAGAAARIASTKPAAATESPA